MVIITYIDFTWLKQRMRHIITIPLLIIGCMSLIALYVFLITICISTSISDIGKIVDVGKVNRIYDSYSSDECYGIQNYKIQNNQKNDEKIHEILMTTNKEKNITITHPPPFDKFYKFDKNNMVKDIIKNDENFICYTSNDEGILILRDVGSTKYYISSIFLIILSIFIVFLPCCSFCVLRYWND